MSITTEITKMAGFLRDSYRAVKSGGGITRTFELG